MHPRDGRVLEELGTYDPSVPDTDARAVLNGERIAYWLGVGAQPSEKVAVLIKKYGKDGTHLDAAEGSARQDCRSQGRSCAGCPRFQAQEKGRRSRPPRPPCRRSEPAAKRPLSPPRKPQPQPKPPPHPRSDEPITQCDSMC